MATQQLDGAARMEGGKRAHPGFSGHKYSLLVVVGEHSAAGFVEYLVAEIERALRLFHVLVLPVEMPGRERGIPSVTVRGWKFIFPLSCFPVY
ncbi:hypothetical protein SRHO_G00175400 [Serrasalmus rhombeus]